MLEAGDGVKESGENPVSWPQVQAGQPVTPKSR
jgi:hypothetical protein